MPNLHALTIPCFIKSNYDKKDCNHIQVYVFLFYKRLYFIDVPGISCGFD